MNWNQAGKSVSISKNLTAGKGWKGLTDALTNFELCKWDKKLAVTHCQLQPQSPDLAAPPLPHPASLSYLLLRQTTCITFKYARNWAGG